jgi:hypothetical protein
MIHSGHRPLGLLVLMRLRQLILLSTRSRRVGYNGSRRRLQALTKCQNEPVRTISSDEPSVNAS